jgi:hypothetical protein
MASRRIPEPIGAGGAVPADILARGRSKRSNVGANLVDPVTGQRIPPARTLAISPADEYPIPGAEFFYENSSSIALAAAAGTVVDGPSLQLKPGQVAVVRSVVIFIDAPTLLTNVTFALLINGSPVPGMDRLREFPRAANNVSKEFDRAIRIPNGSLISMTATNVDAAGPWTVGMEFGGWLWAQVDGEMYTGIPFGAF